MARGQEKQCSACCSFVFPRTSCWLNFPRGSRAWAEGCVSPLGRTWTSPAQPMMNLTLMTLQWGTMSSGKHSGNPSCSGDQSPTAAQQGGLGNSKEPSKDLGRSPGIHLMHLPGGAQAQQVPEASGLGKSCEGVSMPSGKAYGSWPEMPPFFFHFPLSTFFLLSETPRGRTG